MQAAAAAVSGAVAGVHAVQAAPRGAAAHLREVGRAPSRRCCSPACPAPRSGSRCMLPPQCAATLSPSSLALSLPPTRRLTWAAEGAMIGDSAKDDIVMGNRAGAGATVLIDSGRTRAVAVRRTRLPGPGGAGMSAGRAPPQARALARAAPPGAAPPSLTHTLCPLLGAGIGHGRSAGRHAAVRSGGVPPGARPPASPTALHLVGRVKPGSKAKQRPALAGGARGVGSALRPGGRAVVVGGR